MFLIAQYRTIRSFKVLLSVFFPAANVILFTFTREVLNTNSSPDLAEQVIPDNEQRITSMILMWTGVVKARLDVTSFCNHIVRLKNKY